VKPNVEGEVHSAAQKLAEQRERRRECASFANRNSGNPHIAVVRCHAWSLKKESMRGSISRFYPFLRRSRDETQILQFETLLDSKLFKFRAQLSGYSDRPPKVGRPLAEARRWFDGFWLTASAASPATSFGRSDGYFSFSQSPSERPTPLCTGRYEQLISAGAAVRTFAKQSRLPPAPPLTDHRS